MSYLFNRRSDGTSAFFIDGNLQFDSRDEAIYHRCLVSPALLLAERRAARPISVLILGGGDGLAAREALKHSCVKTIDLVDLNEEIVSIAKCDPALTQLNASSLTNQRLSVTISDAWEFVSAARQNYDLIISDFTVPQTKSETRLHSVEFYERLRSILTDAGVATVNAASPCQTPRAYWSIINSMRKARLFVRPYRIVLPSFTQQGYGPDWGFVLASAASFDEHTIQCLEQEHSQDRQIESKPWCRLFLFPQEVADFRWSAPPVAEAVNDLLDSLRSTTNVADPWKTDWDALRSDLDIESVPDFLAQESLIPEAIKKVILSNSADEELIFAKIQYLMPALTSHQTRAMVAEFLNARYRMLSSVDLLALIRCLLARASELPRAALEELRYLHKILPSMNLAQADVTELSARIVTVIALVIVIGNLISPDVAYGKGAGAAHASSSSGGSSMHLFSMHLPSASASSAHQSSIQVSSMAAACSHFGVFGAQHVCTGPLHGFRSNVAGTGFKQAGVGTLFAVNVSGVRCHARHFVCCSNQFYSHVMPLPCTQPLMLQPQIPLYVLAENVYILPDGTVAVMLDDNHSLILGSRCNTIIDVRSGEPLIQLHPDAEQVQFVTAELDRQASMLEHQKLSKESRLAWAGNAGIVVPDEERFEIANITMAVSLLHHSKELLAPPVTPVIESSFSSQSIADGKAETHSTANTESAGATASATSAQPAEATATAASAQPAGATATAASAQPAEATATAADKAESTAKKEARQTFSAQPEAARSTPVGENSAGENKAGAEKSNDPAQTKEQSVWVEPAHDSTRLLPGILVDNHGRYIILLLPDGTNAYMTGRGWYSDSEFRQPLAASFPESCEKFLRTYMQQQERMIGMRSEQAEEQLLIASSHLENLLAEKGKYELRVQQERQSEQTRGEENDAQSNGDSDRTVLVHFGTLEIPVDEAIRRINIEIASAEQQIVEINRATSQARTDVATLKSLYKTLKRRS